MLRHPNGKPYDEDEKDMFGEGIYEYFENNFYGNEEAQKMFVHADFGNSILPFLRLFFYDRNKPYNFVYRVIKKIEDKGRTRKKNPLFLEYGVSKHFDKIVLNHCYKLYISNIQQGKARDNNFTQKVIGKLFTPFIRSKLLDERNPKNVYYGFKTKYIHIIDKFKKNEKQKLYELKNSKYGKLFIRKYSHRAYKSAGLSEEKLNEMVKFLSVSQQFKSTTEMWLFIDTFLQLAYRVDADKFDEENPPEPIAEFENKEWNELLEEFTEEEILELIQKHLSKE